MPRFAVISVFFIVLGLPITAYSDPMAQQIEAVKRAHQEQRTLELEREREKLEREREKAAAAAAKAREKEAILEVEKQRNQKYEDSWRELDLEERKLEIERQRAVTNRSNDYIDRELNMMDAEADVVNSIGDSNRNISEGAKSMMQGIGEGAAGGSRPGLQKDVEELATIEARQAQTGIRGFLYRNSRAAQDDRDRADALRRNIANGKKNELP